MRTIIIILFINYCIALPLPNIVNKRTVPIHIPVNATGNSGNVIGALNPTFDNTSSNS